VTKDQLQVRREEEGIIINVKVIPRSSKTALEGIQNGALRIRLTSPPVENAANRDLVKFLSGKLKVPKSAVQIVGGAKSREKKLALFGVKEVDILKLITVNK
jgi:uncharacterized protein (TIGR00251 family)